VRGEDSFVRAAWAARPLVWQIYPQDENVHLEKLEAWLARYPAPETAHALIRAWNESKPGAEAGSEAGSIADSNAGRTAPAVAAALAPDAWLAWSDAARDWNASQSALPGLAENLATFCAELAKKR